MKFKILEHTADLRVQVWGATLEELFRNALIATFTAMKSKVSRTAVSRKVGVEAPDIDALLVSFLNECVSQGEINQEIYEDIKFESFSNQKLLGELIGKKRKSIGFQIKAVTFHDVKIMKAKNQYTVTIIYDI